MDLEGEVVVEPPADTNSNLPYLGGLPTGAFNKVPDFGSAVYLNLRRPAKLPPPTVNINKAKKDAKAAFLKLWNGSFRAKYRFTAHDQDLYLLISLDGPETDKYSGELLVIRLTTMQLGHLEPAVAWGCIDQNPEFSASFKEKAKEELAHRCLYRFLRSHWTIFARNNSTRSSGSTYPVVDRAGAFLWGDSANDPKLRLDVAICHCDVVINHPQSDGKSQKESSGIRLSRVGEALEGTGEFEKAAMLYRYAADFCITSDLDIEQHALLLSNSALAYKRDGQLEKAEEASICALHALQRGVGSNWDLNTPSMTTVLSMYW